MLLTHALEILVSRLTDLLSKVTDVNQELGEELQREFKNLENRRAFGLNFERHHPESIELPERPIRKGEKVRVLPIRGSSERGDKRLWKVVSVLNKKAELIALDSSEPTVQTVALNNLIVVAEFQDVIYPGLKSTGKIKQGGDKPYHTVINGENFHTLEALTFTHRGKIDAIYIDPPYNKTNRQDWKYNNNYVDQEDDYRHSKWLAMMERRLFVAKELLNPEKSVLIVTIDESEYLRLGLLLEQVFLGCRIQMISTNIKPSGVAREKEFYRVDEYIFFVYVGAAAVIDATIPGLCITEQDTAGLETDDDEDAEERQQPQNVRWTYLLRSGSGAQREESKLKFYPVLVDIKKKKIVGCGDVLPMDKHPSDYTAPKGLKAIWPIREDGTEGRWQLNSASFAKLLNSKHLKISNINDDGNVTIVYLSDAKRKQIESGEINIVGSDQYGGIEVEYADQKTVKGRPKTQWSTKAHSATDHGTSLIRKFIPRRKFSNPKSLYAVEDTLRFFIADNPNATVLDFFAGSGTTAHAVMRLNREDEGQRQSISVTNNEVSSSEVAKFRKAKLRPGDKNWEKMGICEYITKPRIKAAITGKTPEGKRVAENYSYNEKYPMSDGFMENAEFFTLTYESPVAIEHKRAFSAISPLLWMRAGSKGDRIESETKQGWAIAEAYCILFDLDATSDFCSAVKNSNTIELAYIVSDDEGLYQAVVQMIPGSVECVRLPERYLSTFRFEVRRGE